MVRPMDDSALLAPDILAVKADPVACFESGDSRGDVDIVCDEQCLPRRETNDESLVTRPVLVVSQHPSHDALALDLYVASPTLECTTDGVVVGYRRRGAFNRLS